MPIHIGRHNPNREQTAVLFRVWKNGEVLAIFPEVPMTLDGQVSCFVHVGGHSGGNLQTMIQRSRPAEPAEYRALAVELHRRGYRLVVYQRASKKMAEKRVRELARYKESNEADRYKFLRPAGAKP